MVDVNVHLPFFAYGALKKDEIAWPVVEKFVEGSPVQFTLKGYELCVQGGVLTAKESPDGFIEGELITFKPGAECSAYGEIAKLEWVPHGYIWAREIHENIEFNLLVATKEGKQSKFDYSKWTTASDPMLGEGPPYVCQALTKIANEYKPDLDNANANFLQLQATYLLEWSIFERLLRLRYSPSIGIDSSSESLSSFLAKLQKISEWQALFQESSPFQMHRSVSTRNPNGSSTDTKWSQNPLFFLYRLRNNIIHRGKGTASDFYQLLSAAQILNNVISLYLQNNCPNLMRVWNKRLDAKTYVLGEKLFQLHVKN